MKFPWQRQAPLNQDTFFRRAEGVSLAFSPCSGQFLLGDRPVPRGAVELLGRLSQWATATQVATTLAQLAALEKANAVFWAPQRPSRALTGSPLGQRAGPVRLRGNVWPKLLLRREERVDVFPFMARRGMLVDAALVGLQCAVFEWGKKTLELRMECCPQHGAALRALLPRLNGWATWEQLAADPQVAGVLDALDVVGMLESCGPHTKDQGSPAQVTWLGHAAVLYQAGGTRLLVDPLFHPRSIPQRAHQDTPPDPRALGHIDAVLITHGDNDHLNAQALQWLPPDTPVIIPRASARHPYQVDLEGMLAVLGFHNITALAPWEETQVGEVRVTAAPFVGEDWGLTLPACTYLLQHPALNVYLTADAVLMEDVCQQVAARTRVDLALLGVTGCAETHLAPPGFGYGAFYAVWIPRHLRNRWVELCAGPEQSARAAVLLGARRAFGYAAGGADFVPVAFSDRGTHAQLDAALRQLGHPGVPCALTLGQPFLASAL